MKRFYVLLVSLLCSISVLVGCTKPPTPSVQEGTTDEETLTTKWLSNETTTDYYRTILPYKSSPTRGLIYSSKYSKVSNRYDIDYFELALMRESQSYFDPENFYFQEGQYLTKETVKQMLSKKKTQTELEAELENDPEYVDLGLNPSSNEVININGIEVTSPVYLAYLLEQDYLIQEGDEALLNGVTIGLALNPYQSWQNELGYTQVVALDEETLIAKGKEIAQEVIQILRNQEEFKSIPIMIGLYIVEEESAVTPGHMVAKTLVAAESEQIKDWKAVNEHYYLLPNENTFAIDANISNQYSEFKEIIKEYYPHYYGIIGVAHFIDNKLENLEITVNIDFYGLAEKISFHQLLSQLIKETFSPQYNINVVVRSSDEIYGVLLRPANSDEVELKIISWK